MATSPPPSFTPAGSPPNPAHAQLPSKKRGSSAADLTVNPAFKRRKASIMSATSAGSAHPLRQTSFPPEDSQGNIAYSPTFHRSPSVDGVSLVSGSQVSGAPAKKKRGRKSKAERAREAAARGGTPGVAGAREPSVVSGSGAGGGKQQGGGGGGGGDDDGDGKGDGDEIPENMASQAAARSKEQIKEEERLRAMLKQRMSEDQFERYEVWHRSKLPLAGVRKYINSVTSQSVTQTIPQAMQAVCKLFVGDIIEEARRVQDEWTRAGEPRTEAELAAASQAPDAARKQQESLSESSKARRQAPLRPEHFAEAYRRWKNANPGGGSGGSSMYWNQQTHNGAERFAPKLNGRRLFR